MQRQVKSSADVLRSLPPSMLSANSFRNPQERTVMLDDVTALPPVGRARALIAHGGPSYDLPWPPARNQWNLDHAAGGPAAAPANTMPIPH